MKNVILLLVLILSILSCRKQEEVEPEPYEQEIFEFVLWDYGLPSAGYCGKVIGAEFDSMGTPRYFKAIDLPLAIDGPLISYKGRFKIFPETYICKDGISSPLPGGEIPTDTLQFITILEWEKK